MLELKHPKMSQKVDEVDQKSSRLPYRGTQALSTWEGSIALGSRMELTFPLVRRLPPISLQVNI